MSMDKALLDQLKSLDPDITRISDNGLRHTLKLLLNAVEQLVTENQQLIEENQQLKDEINRLKGEPGRPTIRPQKKDGDVSSESERRQEKPKGKRPKRRPPVIHQRQRCRVDRSILPDDAVYKGTEKRVIQDIELNPFNTEFHQEVYYSASQGKRIIGELPPGYEGEFGPGVKSLVIILHHDANVSQPAIHRLLNTCGLTISPATISRILTDKAGVFSQEKTAIVEAGLQSTRSQHIDDTGARVNGKNHYVTVLCNALYTAYFTRPNKERLTVLELLSPGGMTFCCDLQALELMKSWGLPVKQQSRLSAYISDRTLTQAEMNAILDTLFPDPHKQVTNRKIVLESCAIIAYRRRPDAVDLLVCDDAPQFKMITRLLSLCWVHEGRHYKKLKPVLTLHRQQVDTFLSDFWAYYRQLLTYKTSPSDQEAMRLRMAFDELVKRETGYDLLDDRIEKTRQKKAELLLVLDYPEIALHNNASELGARVQARKRDVSLQTKNQAGTQAKDSFMTVIQTAKKLRVNTLSYVKDRLTSAHLPSLAQLIFQRSQPHCDTS